MNNYDRVWAIITGIILFLIALSFPYKHHSFIKTPLYGSATNGFWEATGKLEYELIWDIIANDPHQEDCYMLGTGHHGSDSTERMPTDWILYGSLDGDKWVVLDKKSREQSWKMNEDRYFKIAKTSNIRHVKLKILSPNKNSIVRLYRFNLGKGCPS